MRFWPLLLLCLPLSGCGRFTAEEAASTGAADSATATPQLQVDSTGLPPAVPGEPLVDSAAVPVGETLLQADTTSLSLEELSSRVRRLEGENDSLRIALRTLVPLLGPGNEAVREPAAAPQAEILQVDGDQVRNWGIRTLVALIFLALAGLVVNMAVWVIERLAERNAKRRMVFKRLVPITRILIWAIAAFFVIRVVFSVAGQEFLAAGAAIGVVVGLAAQDILKNIFGGLILLFDQPFQVGDKISVGDSYGEVVAIGLRSTRITTPDDSLVTVPNARVVDGQVSNANAGELNCQVVTDLYLPGWVDEKKAKQIAYEAAASSKYVFLDKPIAVLVKDEYQDTFLIHLKVKAYVLDPRYEFLFMSDVTERARSGFRKAGLVGPMHGARAYVDVGKFPEVRGKAESGKEGEG